MGTDTGGASGTGPPADPAGSTAPGEAQVSPLRHTAIAGGGYLAVREGLGMAVRLGGVVVVTRIIGPHEYGIYVAAVTVVTLLATAAQLGSEIWLIRQPDEPTPERYDETFSFLAVVSVGVTAAAIGLSWPVGLVYHDAAALDAFRILALSVPVNILWAPAQGKLERAFQYRKVAWLELGGDVALYAAAVPLALLGAGVYAPIVGYIAWQTSLFAGSLVLARLRPRWRWSPAANRQLLRHGVTYSGSSWVDQFSTLANPVIVGAFAGATGVGIVGLATRLTDTAGFALRAAWRLGISAISRIVDEPARLRVAIEDGTLAQAVVLGGPLAAVAVLSPWLIPFVFGSPWRDAVGVYCLLALARFVGSPGLLHMTVLYAKGWNVVVSGAVAVRTVILAGVSALLIPVVGVEGFALGSLVSVAAWVILDRRVRRLTPFTYWASLPVLVALGVPMLSPFVPWPLRLLMLLPAGLLVALPQLRRTLLGFARIVLRALRPAGRPAASSSSTAT